MSWKSWPNTDDGETEESLTSAESLDALLLGSTASEHSSDFADDEADAEKASDVNTDEDAPASPK